MKLIERMVAMNRVYHKFEDWEDYKNGMYDSPDGNDAELLQDAIRLLSDLEMFFAEGKKMIFKWVVSASENLSNVSQNRRAWIGQATCCFVYGIPETITREAWGQLTDIQRFEANKIADKIISIYENENKKLRSNMGKTMLF
jgi:hypothetical protein